MFIKINDVFPNPHFLQGNVEDSNTLSFIANEVQQIQKQNDLITTLVCRNNCAQTSNLDTRFKIESFDQFEQFEDQLNSHTTDHNLFVSIYESRIKIFSYFKHLLLYRSHMFGV